MVEGRWGGALRRYLCALAAGSSHFSKRAADEAGTARRAARCCLALNSPTQAAALCQLPDDPDYTTAFKCLAEKVTFYCNVISIVLFWFLCVTTKTR